MEAFQKIIGHEDIKRYFKTAIASGQLAHSYIFEGIEGVGKKTLAYELCKVLLCESEHRPCGNCKACKLIEADNHPDIIKIEKDTKVTKIDTIREHVIKEMDIKPFGKYKIMLITEADTLTIEGQNAMLKTIEEPPAYGIIILMTQNIDHLLQTIRSRCIHLRFNPLTQEAMGQYLQKYALNEQEKTIYTLFSEGSIGIAKKLVEDEDFSALRKKSIDYLQRLQEGNLIQVYDLVKEICDEKEIIPEILKFWSYWYRDLALIKATQTDQLYFKDYETALIDMTSHLTYNRIDRHIQLIQEAIKQINQNIYPTFVIENLLLKLKEKKR